MSNQQLRKYAKRGLLFSVIALVCAGAIRLVYNANLFLENIDKVTPDKPDTLFTSGLTILILLAGVGCVVSLIALLASCGSDDDQAYSCSSCGYDLRGNFQGNRCPECGMRRPKQS